MDEEQKTGTEVVEQNQLVDKMAAETIQKHWKFFMIEGALFWLLGVCAIAMPLASGLGFEVLLGILFCIGGVLGLIRSAIAKAAPGRLVSILISVLFLLSGLLLLRNPMKGVMAITLFLAIFFAVEGVTKLAYGLTMKAQKNGGLFFLDGILSIIIAIIVWSEWPQSAAWFLGLIIGIKLIIAGCSMFMIGLAGSRTAES